MNSDEWSTREKLAISSYVLNSGGQHWGGNVLRMLLPLGEPDRPSDFFSAKKCAQQYSLLTESAETPRRKRGERSESTESSSSMSSHSSSSIGETIVKKLTLERIEEIKKLIRAEKSKYRKLKHTIDQINSGEMDDKLDSMIADMNKRLSPKLPDDHTEKPTEKIQEKNNNTLSQQQTVKPVSSSSTLLPTCSTSVSTTTPQKLNNDVTNVSPKLDENTNKDNSLLEKNKEIPNNDVDLKTELVTDADAEFLKSEINEPTPFTEIIPTITLHKDTKSLNVETPKKSETVISVSDEVHKITTVKDFSSFTKNDQENDETTLKPEISPLKSFITTQPDLNPETKPVSTKDIPKNSELQNEIASPSKNKDSQNITEDISVETNTRTTDTSKDHIVTSKDSVDISPSEENKHSDKKFESETKEGCQITSTQKEKEVELENEEVISHQSLSVTDDYADSEKLEDSSIGYPLSMPSTPAYVDSFPSSPALSNASDADLESSASSRAWKKSIMILWKQVASHRYASLFLQPVTDDIAPNYSKIVYRAMDLSLLKKNLETGVVRTTSDFQRDLMLMFENALMYNNIEHDVYKMTMQMQSDVMDQVAQFLATQLMLETVQQTTPKGLRRSTLRKSAVSEKVSEARSKRTAAIEGENRYAKK